MIYLDKNYFPSDQTGDQGDSCMRAGVLLLTQSSQNIKFEAALYEKRDGFFVRHPEQSPWNNEKNFTRDQMMPFIAGLNNHGIHHPVTRHFYERMKCFFFAQNTERDKVGSRKMKCTHYFYKNSIPNTTTWTAKQYHSGNIVPVEGFEIECKAFDSADPLLPNHIGALILAGKVWAFAPLLILAYPAHILSLLIHALQRNKEQNQMIAECSIYKTIWLYKRIVKWESQSEKYWSDRNEIEYHQFLKHYVENV